MYDKLLSPINKIKLTKTNRGSSRHLYVIRIKNRDKLKKYLLKKGISCQMHYPYSLNKLEAFKGKFKKSKLKNSESWANECLSLPIHPNLKEKDVLYIVNQVKNFFSYP
jgi:dTDP-4-amino-4,6-dideoxygalactose transaminase